MERYYCLKLVQAFATLFLLMQIGLTPRHLYGCFIGKEELCKVSARFCHNNMTLYSLNKMGTAKNTDDSNPGQFVFWTMAASKVDLLSNDTLPIGCLKIELDSGLGSCFNAGNNQLDVVADMFAMPISFAHIYLVLLIIHTVLQLQPEYNSCAYMFVYFGAITWLFSCVQFALLLSHWEEFWRCSNFRSYWPSVISIGLVVSFLMFFCCVFELLYNPELMHSGGKKKPAANISNYNNGTKNPGALDYNKDQGSLGTATSSALKKSVVVFKAVVKQQ